MQLTALTLALCLLAVPATGLAQYNPYTDTWENLDFFDTPSRDYSDNPALDRELDRWDREQERATLQALEEQAHRENARMRALAACSTIWNNPAAAAACRERHGW